ncbi:MAG TPA: hypothetical protein VFU06_17125, partial [Longimicrobiales bacterium]|nr:hypothetical protein [Longimicrobiales bacterium]
MDLYRHLYETRYGFHQRQDSEAVLPIAPSARFEPLFAATFGGYSPSLKHYEAAYRKVFAPEEVKLSPDNLFSTLLRLSPLAAGSFDLRVRRGSIGGMPGVLLYLADPASSSDVIDYWNLRTLDLDVLPVPLPWLTQMTPAFEWLLDRVRSSLDEKARPHITLIGGRSVSEQQLHALWAHVKDIAADAADMHISYYPRVWHRWGREADNFRIAEVTADGDEQEISVSGREVTLACLAPGFTKNSAVFGTARWVNVFQLRNYAGDPHFPEVLLPDLQDAARLFKLAGLGEIWPNVEGLAISADGIISRQQIRIPTGEEALAALFKRSGYSSSLSDAGVVAHQLAVRLRYRHAISMFADLNLIRLLERMSKGHRATRSQMLEHLKIGRELFKDAPKRRLERLVEAGVLRVGLEVRCDVCRSRNWVDLKAIDH